MALAAPSAEGWVMWDASDDIPKPDDLGVNASASGPRGFERLEHQHGAAFAQHHPAAVLRKRPAGIRRNDAQRLPCLENSEAEGRLAAARDGQGRHARPHHPERLADGMRGRGTRGGNRVARAGDAEFHGDVAGTGVGHGLGNGQGMHAVLAHLVYVVEPGVLGRLSAHARAGDNGARLAQFRGPFECLRRSRPRAPQSPRTARSGP